MAMLAIQAGRISYLCWLAILAKLGGWLALLDTLEG
jgi:hypothetical protein